MVVEFICENREHAIASARRKGISKRGGRAISKGTKLQNVTRRTNGMSCVKAEKNRVGVGTSVRQCHTLQLAPKGGFS